MPQSLRTALVFLLAVPAFAQPTAADRTQILKLVDANAAQYKQVSKEIWGFVELYCLSGTKGENQYGPDPLARVPRQ